MNAVTWGSTPAERADAYPCDRLIHGPDQCLHRAISIEASRTVVYRWVCQLTIAPYSYDWIDNRGRRSPRHLTPGADRLYVGQSVMRIFRIVDFVVDEHVTVLASSDRLDLHAAVSYVTRSQGSATRLIARVRIGYPRGPAGVLLKAGLPTGDLIMMRRQLLNLKRLAETSAPPGDQPRSSSR